MFLGGCLKRTSSYFFIFCLFFVINPTNYKSIAHKIPFSTFISLIIHSIPPFLSLFLLADHFSDVKCNSQYSEVHDNLIQDFMSESLIPLFHFSCPKTASTSTGLLLLCSNPFGEVSFSRASCLYHLSLWFALSPNL